METNNSEPNVKNESLKQIASTETCTVCSSTHIVTTPGNCGKG